MCNVQSEMCTRAELAFKALDKDNSGYITDKVISLFSVFLCFLCLYQSIYIYFSIHGQLGIHHRQGDISLLKFFCLALFFLSLSIYLYIYLSIYLWTTRDTSHISFLVSVLLNLSLSLSCDLFILD